MALVQLNIENLTNEQVDKAENLVESFLRKEFDNEDVSVTVEDCEYDDEESE